MTNTPANPGGPSLHEATFNIHLAQALRNRRVSWRKDQDTIVAERTGVVSGCQSLRIDILIQPETSYPVAIETEVDSDPSADAITRLGLSIQRSSRPVMAAVGVRVPADVRNWADNEVVQRLSITGIDGSPFVMEYAVFSLGRNQEPIRWPEDGWISGTVSDIADICEAIAIPQYMLTDITQEIATGIHGVAYDLQRELPKHVSRSIADSIGQKDILQGLRLTCCIWMATLRICDLLAPQTEMKRRGLLSIAQLRRESARNDRLLIPHVKEQWNIVLKYNYRSVVAPAVLTVVDTLPLGIASEFMGTLGNLAERVNADNLGEHVDFTGQLFPEMLEDRKQTAAFYTLPDLATILANVAVDALPVTDWADLKQVSCLSIADFACGTGTLLRSAYKKVARNYQDAGGDDLPALHKQMMEGSITGTDINALATHMTAAALSTINIEQLYESTNIGAVPVKSGRTGALELLQHQQVPTITGAATKTELISSTKMEQIHATDREYSLVIQNPPYSRGRGGAKLFDIAGISERERKQCVARLNKLRSKSKFQIGNGKAGLASDFSELALQKLGEHGVFASVLPLTAAKAISWAEFRHRMLTNFAKVVTIAFPTFSKQAVSADTGMKEFLIVAIDYDPVQVIKDCPELISVNFHQRPGAEQEAIEFARQVSSISDEADTNEGRIATSTGIIGEWSRYTVNDTREPWFPVGCRSNTVSSFAINILRGNFNHIRHGVIADFSLPMMTVGVVCEVGPTHDLIGHPRGGDPRGAFVFDPIKPHTTPDYPALWAADNKTQRKLIVLPTHSGWPHDEEKTAERWETRSNLAISRNLDMTSQPLAAAWLPEPAMGGSTWTTLKHQDQDVLKSILIWFNSTLGLVARWAYGQTTQHGRARLQIGDISSTPIPDFSAQTPAGDAARQLASQEFKRLAQLELRQVALAAVDESRREIDHVALQMLGIDSKNISDALANVRSQWCAEPSVNGLRATIVKQLEASTD